jgi:hypothetical protein
LWDRLLEQGDEMKFAVLTALMFAGIACILLPYFALFGIAGSLTQAHEFVVPVALGAVLLASSCISNRTAMVMEGAGVILVGTGLLIPWLMADGSQGTQMSVGYIAVICLIPFGLLVQLLGAVVRILGDAGQAHDGITSSMKGKSEGGSEKVSG